MCECNFAGHLSYAYGKGCAYMHMCKLCILMSPCETMVYFKNIKFKKYNYNSYDDIGVFIFTVVLPRMVTLINRPLLYIGRILLLN
jgi:hypothetical protein